LFKVVKIIVLAVIAGVAAFMIYDYLEGPVPVVIAKKQQTATSQISKKVVPISTRQLRRGEITYWEVRTPGGAWLDCAGDCAETYRREILDHWETRDEDAPGGAR